MTAKKLIKRLTIRIVILGGIAYFYWPVPALFIVTGFYDVIRQKNKSKADKPAKTHKERKEMFSPKGFEANNPNTATNSKAKSTRNLSTKMMAKALPLLAPSLQLSKTRLMSPPIVEGKRLLKKALTIKDLIKYNTDADIPCAFKSIRQRVTLIK